MSGVDQIRDVIAFPKTQRGQDLMVETPSPVTEKQLRELHIRLRNADTPDSRDAKSQCESSMAASRSDRTRGAGRAGVPGSEQDAIDGMKAAAQAGRAVLKGGGSALDAVCATVVRLEDNPIFNAGTGAVLNFDGFCELDASVMESRESRMGAVAALQRVKNPILVARKVMEETDHVMLAGEGAQRFARVMGFGDHDPVTPARKADWADKRKRLDEVLGKHGLKMRRFLKDHPEYAGGTVGCVAVDDHGILAAATSTGGVTMKLVGRVRRFPARGRGQLRVAMRRGLGHGHGRVRDAHARRARDLRRDGARRHSRSRADGHPRSPASRVFRRRRHDRRGQRGHAAREAPARATCRTRGSAARAKSRRACESRERRRSRSRRSS